MMDKELQKKQSVTKFEQKVRIGFYLENKSIPNADLRFPKKGNPGIGGSEFGLVSLPYFLSFYIPNIIVQIYANIIDKLPDNITSKKADNSCEAAQKAIQDGCHVLVIRLCDQVLTDEFIQLISGTNLKVIVWAQNNPTLRQMNLIEKSKNISRNVCVGREELDLLRDHPAISKTTYIFNGIYTEPYVPKEKPIKKGNTVVFMGSIIPAKGFHVLAKAWPIVKKNIPDAFLIVIGSGNLYYEDAKLGNWGVADENYERMFRPFLSGKDGNPDESIQFIGKMGAEKIKILQHADIGIVNPNHNPLVGTETFCWSAVEFQACGTAVIAAGEDGLLDTVLNRKTGILTKKESNLANNIVYLLKNNEIREKYGNNAIKFIRNNFEYKEICSQWMNLFYQIINEEPNKIPPMKFNFFYHYKFIREYIRYLKSYIPVLCKIPSFLEISEIYRGSRIYQILSRLF